MRPINFFIAALGMMASTAWAQGLLDQVPTNIPGYDTRFGVPLLARADARLRELGLDVEIGRAHV